MPNRERTATERMILLTGATGYVGGRLLERLERAGRPVRCLTRRPEALLARVRRDRGGELQHGVTQDGTAQNGTAQNAEADTAPRIEVVAGDALKPESLAGVFDGIDTAFYLVHSMGSAGDFAEEDRRAATHFASAAAAAGVRRIIYLGGLGNGDPNADQELSPHLRSRQETGDILRAHHPEIIELRASIVIGSGSLSFEMIRALVERLPVMICPKWVKVKAQPIAIEDLLDYLEASLDLPREGSQVLEIGGPDQVSYGEIMQEYAQQRGLRRLMIPVPLLTPYLSSLWLGLVTPLYARVGRKLIDSLKNPTLVSNNLAALAFPGIRPRGIRAAIARALVNEDRDFAATRWSDAFSSGSRPTSWGGVRFGSRLVDSRTTVVPVSPAEAFAPIRRIGGQTGWYYGDWLWSLRGLLDLLVGGVGIRRGRRDPESVNVGDSLDCWRVEEFEPDHRLRLVAEMRLPGRAWLEFEVTPVEGGSQIRQTAIFDPLGLFGLTYWYGVSPLHYFVFAGMLRNIARAAIAGREKPVPVDSNASDSSSRPVELPS